MTALFIACKYEEIYAPELNNFVIVADNAYSREEILKMEGDIINELDFKFTFTSSHRLSYLFLIFDARFLQKFAEIALLD